MVINSIKFIIYNRAYETRLVIRRIYKGGEITIKGVIRSGGNTYSINVITTIITLIILLIIIILFLRRVLIIVTLLIITVIIISIIIITSIITFIITVITSIIITIIIISAVISIIIIAAVLIFITTVGFNFFFYINTATIINRKVIVFTIAGISTGLYTVFKDIKFDNTGYLNVGFGYNIKIYSVTALINGKFGTVGGGGRGGGGGITGVSSVIIIFSKLIVIFEGFSEVANGFKLFNKNVIFKLGVLNIKGVTNIQGNFRI